MQDFFFFTNNGLTYELNGLTQDGHYFVLVRYPVSVPFLMELEGSLLPPVNLNPQSISIPEWPDTYELQLKIIEDYNTEVLRRLEQMSENQSTPDIALLVALVGSIQVNKPQEGLYALGEFKRICRFQRSIQLMIETCG